MVSVLGQLTDGTKVPGGGGIDSGAPLGNTAVCGGLAIVARAHKCSCGGQLEAREIRASWQYEQAGNLIVEPM